MSDEATENVGADPGSGAVPALEQLRMEVTRAASSLALSAINIAVKAKDPWISPAELIHRTNTILDEAHHAQLEAIAYSRAGGVSWATIGKLLGITRQSAHERFGARIAQLEESKAEDAPSRALQVSSLETQELVALATRLDQWHSSISRDLLDQPRAEGNRSYSADDQPAADRLPRATEGAIAATEVMQPAHRRSPRRGPTKRNTAEQSDQ